MQLSRALFAVAIVSIAGCDKDCQQAGGGVDAGIDPPGIMPPGPGPILPPDGVGSVTFAVNRIFLGDTTRDGTTDSAAWKDYGYDLDGRTSTRESVGLCEPAANATPSNVYPDGNLGRDNSFGKNVLPILTGLDPMLATALNGEITAGRFTLLLDLEALGAGADYNPIVTRQYHGATLGQPPRFDGTDTWPVESRDLVDPTNLRAARFQFPTSYLTGDTWVSGVANLYLLLPTRDGHLELVLSSATITMELDAAHTRVTGGTIAGVLATDSFIEEVSAFLRRVDPSFCDPTNPTIASVAQQLRQASDIMNDGRQDPTKTCDGISIGLGFDAARVVLGQIHPSVADPPACPP